MAPEALRRQPHCVFCFLQSIFLAIVPTKACWLIAIDPVISGRNLGIEQ